MDVLSMFGKYDFYLEKNYSVDKLGFYISFKLLTEDIASNSEVLLNHHNIFDNY